MKYLFSGIIGLTGLIILGSVFAQESRPSVSMSPREAAIDAELRAPFTLRGKVVDYDGNPIEGADVTIEAVGWHLRGPSERGQYHLKTSASGEFDLDGQSMTRLTIKIDKPGYEFRENRNPSFFSAQRIWPDPNRREIYRLRKRETPTYVDDLQLGWAVDSHTFDQAYRVDLFRNGVGGKTILEPGNEEFPGRFNTDLEFRIRSAEEKDWYVITIRAVKENSGIQRIDKEFFKAPDTGYEKEINVKIKVERRGDLNPIYICAKTGQPARYARLDLALVGEPDRFSVSIKGLANPFGEQSFEFDPEFLDFTEVYGELSNVVREASRKGERPVKPDIKKMKDEARAKRKEKELQRQQATSSAPAGAATTTLPAN